MKRTRGASATTRLTKRKQHEEGNEYGQILPTTEQESKEKRNLCHNKALQTVAGGGRQRVQLPTEEVILMNSRSGISATTRLTKNRRDECS